jgi:hypothetical protein
VEIVLLIGAAEYPLEEVDARWLEHVTRSASVDESGRSLDHRAAAALQVADVIAEDLERGISDEPIELGRANVDGLLAYAFPSTDSADVHAHIARSDGLAGLYLALRRFHTVDVDPTP